MPPIHRTPRINLQEFKARFVRILGPTKESQYWGLLSSFLSFRLTKAELDRLVPSTIGKENVVLHNQFVRAIFMNVICAEAPAPPSSIYDTSKPVKESKNDAEVLKSLNAMGSDTGIRRKPITPSSGGEDSPPPASPGVQGVRSNGDGFPISPRKGRSGIRDRKATERPSPLGNHKGGEASTSQGTPSDDENPRALENGNLGSPDLLRPLQQLRSAYEHSNLDDSPLYRSKRPRYGDVHSYNGKHGANTKGMELDEEEEEEEEEEYDEEQGVIWVPPYIKPPLGLPFCIPSAGGARMAPGLRIPQGPITQSLIGEALDGDCSDTTTLPNMETLRHRMEQGAVLESGLGGCDEDSVRVVRLALEIHLQKMLKAVIELTQLKRLRGTEVPSSCKENGGGFVPQQRRAKGIWAGSNQSADGEPPEDACPKILPFDLYVAMDLNPTLLGENFPILLEKILLRVCREQK